MFKYKSMRLLFLTVISVFHLNVDAQNIISISENNLVKSTEMVLSSNSVKLISQEAGINTYSIVNDKVRKELFFNSKKRDKITALPGFFELGLSGNNEPMRVKIDVDYADEYLNKYFRGQKSVAPNNSSK